MEILVKEMSHEPPASQVNARWSEIAKLGFDQRFHRMWNFYLCACAAGFSAGTTNVTQIALRRTP